MSNLIKITHTEVEEECGFSFCTNYVCADNDPIVHKKLHELIKPLVDNADMCCRIEKTKDNKSFVFTGEHYNSDYTYVVFPVKYKTYVENLSGVFNVSGSNL